MAVTAIVIVPAVVGVPLNARVEAVKVSHAGSGAPPDKVALYSKGSLFTSAKVFEACRFRKFRVVLES